MTRSPRARLVSVTLPTIATIATIATRSSCARVVSAPVLAALLVVALGCGESTTPSEPDAGIVFTPPDAGPPEPDAGPPPPPPAGGPCASDTDCPTEAPTCILDPDFSPEGYCSQYCVPGESACPDGSVCTQVNMTTSLCLDACDPAASDCRDGYGCADLAPAGAVCVGGCDDDADCGATLRCDAEGGVWMEGACYDPDASLGDACAERTECPMDHFCLVERFRGWPGGACLAFGCDPVANTGCAGDAQCIGGLLFGDAACADGCETDADCREGYACRADATYPERRYCGPGCTTHAQCTGGRVCNLGLGTCGDPFDPMALGQACTGRRSCPGGTCLTETSTGFPGGYCAYLGCTLGVADDLDGCPGDGVCVDRGDGTGACADGCASAATCRRGYDCQPSVAGDPMSATACLPACMTSDVCTGAGYTCDVMTGRCAAP